MASFSFTQQYCVCGVPHPPPRRPASWACTQLSAKVGSREEAYGELASPLLTLKKPFCADSREGLLDLKSEEHVVFSLLSGQARVFSSLLLFWSICRGETRVAQPGAHLPPASQGRRTREMQFAVSQLLQYRQAPQKADGMAVGQCTRPTPPGELGTTRPRKGQRISTHSGSLCSEWLAFPYIRTALRSGSNWVLVMGSQDHSHTWAPP